MTKVRKISDFSDSFFFKSKNQKRCEFSDFLAVFVKIRNKIRKFIKNMFIFRKFKKTKNSGKNDFSEFLFFKLKNVKKPEKSEFAYFLHKIQKYKINKKHICFSACLLLFIKRPQVQKKIWTFGVFITKRPNVFLTNVNFLFFEIKNMKMHNFQKNVDFLFFDMFL